MAETTAGFALRQRSRRRLAAVVLLGGLLLTTVLTVAAQRTATSRADERFAAVAAEARSALQQRLRSLTDVSLALRATLMTAGASRETFDQLYVLADRDRLLDGVQAVSFDRLVPTDGTDAFVAAERADRARAGLDPAGFEVHPERTVHDDRFVVQYVHPLAGNEAALGLDIGSDPHRRAAVERARDLGEPAATGPLVLVQDDGGEVPAVLVVTPVYATDTVPVTAPGRRRHLEGVLVLAVRVGDLVQSVVGRTPLLEVALVDVGEITGDEGEPTTEGERLVGPPVTAATLEDAATFDLNLGGRRWRMVATPTGAWSDDSWLVPTLVAVLGLVLTGVATSALASSVRTRARLEREVALRTAELRALLLNAPDATLVVGRDGTVELASRQVETLLGHAPEDVVGQPVELLLLPEDRERHVTLRASRSGHDASRAMAVQREVLALHRDGHHVPVEVSLATLELDGVDDGRVIASVRDVTERRATQRELEELNEQKTTFLRTVSHELRTPLTAIVGFVQVLRARRGSMEDRAVDDLLDRLARNADGLHALIEEIIGFAALDRTTDEHRPTEVDLTELAAEVVAQLAPVLATHAVRTDVPSTPVVVRADMAAVTRVVTNLLVNAVRYSPAGSEVVVRVDAEGPAVTVEDAGPGIPPEERERVFERFWRGAASRSGTIPGTGIGLAVVAQLVERDGGRVTIGESPAGGASVRVTYGAGATGVDTDDRSRNGSQAVSDAP